MKDAAKASSWAAGSVDWRLRNKILSGTKHGNANPQGNATRAETAKMVVFLHGPPARQNGAVPFVSQGA